MYNLKTGNIYKVLYISDEEDEITILCPKPIRIKRKLYCEECNKDFRHMSYKYRVKNKYKYSKQKININIENV